MGPSRPSFPRIFYKRLLSARYEHYDVIYDSCYYVMGFARYRMRRSAAAVSPNKIITIIIIMILGDVFVFIIHNLYVNDYDCT